MGPAENQEEEEAKITKRAGYGRFGAPLSTPRPAAPPLLRSPARCLFMAALRPVDDPAPLRGLRHGLRRRRRRQEVRHGGNTGGGGRRSRLRRRAGPLPPGGLPNGDDPAEIRRGAGPCGGRAAAGGDP